MKLSTFEDARILCVDHRYNTEKDRLLALLKPHGVNPRFFIDGKGQLFPHNFYGQLSCDPPYTWRDGQPSYNHFRAFRKMITEANKAGKQSLLIVEDDLILTEDFDEVVERVKIPDNWDMIYYGANHSDYKTREIAPNVLRCFGSTTTHCVAFRNTIFDAVLSLPSDRTIDWNIGNRLHPKYHCYAIWPSVALQKPGWSNLWLRPVDYSHLWASRGEAI